MKTTADKLTYLSGTKDALKTAINYTGANITNDTFRSYADKLKLGYIDILNNGTDTLYSNIPKVSGKGSNLSLTPTYEAPMRNIPYGDTLQDGTPTPSSPVPINNVTGLQTITISNSDNTSSNTYEINLGKNLLDVSQCINGYINSNGDWSAGNNNLLTSFIPVVPGSDYTISLNTQFSNIGYALYNASKTYISRENNSNKQTLTISIPNDTFYIKVWFNYSGYTTMTPEYILQYEPMIEKGSTASTYSSYFTPIELNKISTSEDYIKKSTGKNLFDKDNANVLNNIYLDRDNSKLLTSNGTATFYIPCEPNTSYTISKSAITSRFRAGYTSELPANNVSVSNFIQNDTGKSITLPSSATAKYLCVFFYNSAVDTLTKQQILDSIQIEVGPATEYEPYGVGKWYVCKKTGKLTINGTENYTFEVTPNFSNTGKTRFTIYNIPTDYNSNISQIPAMFNIASNSPDAAYSAYNNVILMRYVASQQTRLDMMSNGLSVKTATDFKTWLDNNNLIDYYKLNTPTYTEITNTDLINQLEALYTAKSKSGITNISSTSENLPMILSASALKVE